MHILSVHPGTKQTNIVASARENLMVALYIIFTDFTSKDFAIFFGIDNPFSVFQGPISNRI